MSQWRGTRPEGDPWAGPGIPKGPAAEITSESLFRGGMEVVIRHAGEAYRLRITRQNKLILNK